MSGSLVRWPLTGWWLTSVPWACFRRGPTGQHQFGLHSGNFIQFVFPDTPPFLLSPGSFPLPFTSPKVALKGRVVLENPDQVGDPSAAQVTQLVGIILPFLLHNSVQIPGGKGAAPVSQALYQLRLPVLDRLNTTAETCVLLPISLPLSFFVPVSAFPGLFKHLVGVPFYRLPKTLGWPYSDAPLNGALTPDPPLARLDLSPYSLCLGSSPSSLHHLSVTRLRTTSKVTLVAITLLTLLFTSSKN